MMKMSETMNVELLEQIDDKINTMVSNNNLINDDHDIKSTRIIETTVPNKNSIIFPLSRLPTDIIHKTSLYLNDEDILKYEKCCRLFYTMINNLLYLKQSNNFKTFEINSKRLNQMTQSNCCFYKYSQSNKLVIAGNKKQQSLNHEWVQAKEILLNNKQLQYLQCDQWFKNLLKSIKVLKFDGASTFSLLNKLPIEILFDPQSNLETMIMIDPSAHYPSGKCVQFGARYINLKQTLQQQGKSIKKLQLLQYHSGCVATWNYWPRDIETKWVSITHPGIHWTGDYIPYTIDVLTFRKNLAITTLNNWMYYQQNYGFYIKTLRFIDFDSDSNRLILGVNCAALNLQNSLKNLTLNLNLNRGGKGGSDKKIEEWFNTIDNILRKEYYRHLTNFNLLLELSYTMIEQVFTILRKNCVMLKHQFKQLNIGLKIWDGYIAGIWYHTFEWNSTIDNKFLIEKEKHVADTENLQVEVSSLKNVSDKQQENRYKKKFYQWKQQWCQEITN